MGCLLDISLRASVDDGDKLYKFMRRHQSFLAKAVNVAETDENNRKTLRIFVPWTENQVSRYIKSRLDRDGSVFRAKLIS